MQIGKSSKSPRSCPPERTSSRWRRPSPNRGSSRRMRPREGGRPGCAGAGGRGLARLSQLAHGRDRLTGWWYTGYAWVPGGTEANCHAMVTPLELTWVRAGSYRP
jgi:hypothetical protein